MSNSKRSEGGTIRREEDSRLLYNSKGSKAPVSRAGALGSNREQDAAGRHSILSQCAFHPSEKITNFCTNKECLLPLCPKCVKIHTDEHIKMGTHIMSQGYLDSSIPSRSHSDWLKMVYGIPLISFRSWSA
jgi:hypothetical protein